MNRTFTKSQAETSICFQTFQREAKKAEDTSNILKNIGLTETVWELYQVNALYDFSYEKVKLFEYEELLAQNIKKALLDSDVEFNPLVIPIQFEKFPETAFTEKDRPALKITISATDISEFIDGSTVKFEEIFRGLLLSVERKEGLNEEARLRAKATILPLLLVQYKNKIFLESFIDFLEVNFSCLVSPLKFSSMDLKWILTLSSYPSKEKTCRSTVLEYDTCIDYIIHEDSVHDIFNQLIKPSTQFITEDIVIEFFTIVSKICDISEKDLSKHELIALRTPLGIFRRDGSVHTFQAYDSSKLYFVMRYLTHLAQEVRSL